MPELMPIGEHAYTSDQTKEPLVIADTHELFRIPQLYAVSTREQTGIKQVAHTLKILLDDAKSSIQCNLQVTLANKVALVAWAHLVTSNFATHPFLLDLIPANAEVLRNINQHIQELSPRPIGNDPYLRLDFLHTQKLLATERDSKTILVARLLRSELTQERVRHFAGGAVIAGAASGFVLSAVATLVFPIIGVAGLLTSFTAAGLAAHYADPLVSPHQSLLRQHYGEQFKQESYSIGGHSILLSFTKRRSLVNHLCHEFNLDIREASRDWCALRDNFGAFIERLGHNSNPALLKELLKVEHYNLLWAK